MTNGTTIVGRYRIEGRLGVGGMSTVQLAFDQRLERYVAIKLLAEHLADDPTFVSRFRREALSAARLVHPNIVQVFDFGFDEDAHQHFIVMEHVAGHSCAELLRDHGPMRGRSGGRRRDPGLPRARLRAPQRRRAPGRQAGQPARVRFRCGQARRLRDRPRRRPVEHHPGRVGARDRRLPRPRAGARRGGRPARGSLLARGRRLPAVERPPALRGQLAVRARAQAAAPGARAARRAQPARAARAGRRDLAGARARPGRPAGHRAAVRRGNRRRRPRRRAQPQRVTEPTRNPGGTAATRVLSGHGAPTAQTRVAPRSAPATGRTAAQPRQARQLEARRPAYPPPDGRLRSGRGAPRARASAPADHAPRAASSRFSRS